MSRLPTRAPRAGSGLECVQGNVEAACPCQHPLSTCPGTTDTNYVYPVAEMDRERRTELLKSLKHMPEPIARYKGLFDDRDRILSLVSSGQ
ncbi:MAG: hypothetical protein OXU20_39665 [Myxococcales bacterium]|nr:hypothetical protein [Myxococcales bacterium]